MTYTYDDASRLIGQTYTGPAGPLGDLTYSYDANGNRISTGGSWARSLLPATVPTSNYDGSNAQLGFGDVTQTFDANGNLLTQTDASGTTTYTWDARNRLTALSGPTASASFTYDALGRRMTKSVTGQGTSFLYDGLDAVRESGPSGDTAYLRTLAVDEALIRTDANGSVAYLADMLGSTLALADETGVATTIYTYTPFGETSIAGGPANPFQFTGRENDGTGLYYYRARYYDPVRSRFVSEDPIGVAGGFNFLTYAGNNPTGKRDALGLQEGVSQPESVLAGTPGTYVPGNFPNPMQLFKDVGSLYVTMIALPSLMDEANRAINNYQRGMKCNTDQDVLICFNMKTPFLNAPMVIQVGEPWLADRSRYYCFGPFRAYGNCNSCPRSR